MAEDVTLDNIEEFPQTEDENTYEVESLISEGESESVPNVVTITSDVSDTSSEDTDQTDTINETVITPDDSIVDFGVVPEEPDNTENQKFPIKKRTTSYIQVNTLNDYSADSLEPYMTDSEYKVYAIFNDDTEREVTWDEVYDPTNTSSTFNMLDVARIAYANGQHYWNNDNGVHVTDDTLEAWATEWAKTNHGTLSTPTSQKPWHNILMNSVGIILRTGTKFLSSWSKSGVAFYDGTGNSASNVIASYGSNGAQIGKASEKHVVIDSSGLSVYDENGDIAPVFASNIAADHAKIGELIADTADIATIRANSAKVNDVTAQAITAATGYIAALTAGEIAASDLIADHASIDTLETNTADIATIRANSAKVNNVTAEAITAATGYIGTLTSKNITANDMAAAHANVGVLLANTADIATIRANSAKVKDVTAEAITAATGYIAALNSKNITANDISADHASIDTLEANTADIDTIRANSAKVKDVTAQAITAATGYIAALNSKNITANDISADHASIDTLEANTADIDTIRANSAKVKDVTAQAITAATGYIAALTAGEITASDLIADHASIDTLETNTADIATIRANSAKVNNVTAQAITAATGYIAALTAGEISASDLIADHGEIASLETNYAHITNGVINNAKIGYADVNGLNANYAHITNGVIDNADINHADVVGLNANYAHVTNGIIDSAKIDQADVNNLRTNYAHVTNGVIDESWINHASVVGLDINYAHIENGVINNATIDQADVNDLDTNYAHITDGVIDNATIDQADVNDLDTNYAHITNGVIDNADINHADVVGLNANYAHVTNGVIDNAEIDYADVNDLDAHYAHVTNGVIDQANISHANVTGLSANYAHMVNGVIDNATIDQADVNDLDAYYAHITNGVIDNADINHADVVGLNANYAHVTNGVIDNADISHADVVGLDANFAHITNGIIDNAEIDYADVNDLDAHYAHITNGVIDNADIGYADVVGLNANYAHITNGVIDNAEIDQADVNNLRANYAHITNGNIDNAKIDQAYVTGLETHYASIANGVINKATIDQANVNNLDSHYAHIANGVIDNADINHADVVGLNANYAHVTDGVIDNAEIDYADVNDLDAHYAQIDMANVSNGWITNGAIKNGAIKNGMIESVTASKLTAGTINADNVTITNLKAENIKVSKINGVNVTGKTVKDALEQHEGDISDLDDKIDDAVETLNSRIDSQIETWTTDTIPLLNNYPASSWNTNKLKAEHVGDICYVINPNGNADGYTYRFAYDNTSSSYKWILIKDNQVTAALGRLQTAEGKIGNLETFESNTTTWINDTDDALDTIRNNHTSLSGTVSNLSGTVSTKVDTSTFNNLSQTVNGNSQSISQITETQTNIQQNAIKKSTQLWYSKNDATPPAKPTAKVTSTSLSANAWRVIMPQHRAQYPYYFYCWQYEYVDGSCGWSDIVLDDAASLRLVGGTNLLPCTQSNRYNGNDYSGNGITIHYEGDGWWRISGVTAVNNNGRDKLAALWASSDYTTKPLNDKVPQNGGVELCLSVEVEGDVFVKGTDETDSTWLTAYGINLAGSFSVGGYTDIYQWSTTFSNPVALIAYKIDRNTASGVTLDGRFRVKLEYGSYATAWTPSPDDIYYEVNEVASEVETKVSTQEFNNLSDTVSGHTQTIGIVQNKLETVANPNLCPPLNVETDTRSNLGWYVNRRDLSNYTRTPLANGWEHFEGVNDTANQCRIEVYAGYNDTVKLWSIYTFLIEVRNNNSGYLDGTTSGNVLVYVVQNSSCQFYGGTITDLLEGTGSNTSIYLTPNGPASSEVYIKRYTKSPTYENVSGLVCFTIRADAGTYFSVDLRISLYAGRYLGPYKPYVDPALRTSLEETNVQINEVSNAVSGNSLTLTNLTTRLGTNADGTQTSTDVVSKISEINQDIDDISLSVTSVESYAKTNDTNMLLDWNAPTISKNQAKYPRYWSDATNEQYITCALVESNDVPEERIKYIARFTGNGTHTDNRIRALAFYNSGNSLTAFSLIPGQKYTVSAWFRCTSGTCLGAIRIRIANAFKYVIDPTRLTSQWTRFETTFIQPESNDYYRIWFYSYFEANTSGVCEICGFKLTPGESAEHVMNYASSQFEIQANQISSKVEQNGVISSINQSSEQITIDASRVNIAGAAIFSNYYTKTQVNDVTNTLAPKSSAATKTQRIWYRTTTIKTLTGPTTWVTASGDIYNDWTTKCPPLASNLNSGGTKYPYLYTCVQTQTVAQAANNGTSCTCSAVLLDDSTTVIDGGKLITGSVAANKIDATDINASGMLTVGALSQATQNDILNENIIVGGRNLTLNGNAYYQYDIRSTNVYFSCSNPLNEPNARRLNTTEYGKSLLSDTNNEFFTVSFDYTITDLDTECYLYVGLQYGASSYSATYPYVSKDKTDILPVGNSSGHHSFTFTPRSEHRAFGGAWLFNLTGSTSNNRNAKLTIHNFKFELGTKETGFSLAPENIDAMNNPNILPFFSIDPNDSNYWYTFERKNTSSSNTEGYEACYIEPDGWAHIIEDTRAASGNQNKTGYQNLQLKPNAIVPFIKPNTVYTLLIEVKDLIGSHINYIFTTNNSTQSLLNAFTNDYDHKIYKDGVYYSTITSKSAEELAQLTMGNRGYIWLETENNAECRMRISLYEGYYSGPYKPYVGKLLYPTNTDLATTNLTLSGAVVDTQTIYIQAVSGTNTIAKKTDAWVTIATESTVSDTTGLTPAWTTKRPTYRSNYPVIFIAQQTKLIDGTVVCSTPVKDDTLTIIDGGHITTGTIDASKVNVTNLDASKITTGKVQASQINSTDLHVSAANIDGKLTANQINASGLSIGYSQLTNVPSIPSKVTDLSDGSSYAKTSEVAAAIDDISVGGRNLLFYTSDKWMGPYLASVNANNCTMYPYYTDDTSWVVSGRYLTLTFEIEVNMVNGTGGTPAIYPQMYVTKADDTTSWASSTTSGFSTVLIDCINQIGSRSFVAGNNTYRYSYTGVINITATDAKSVRFGLRFDYVGTNTYVKFRNVKLELGNKATAWSPAPEDLSRPPAKNLHPFYTRGRFDIYDSVYNPKGAIQYVTAQGDLNHIITYLDDGWLHCHFDNSSGTAEYSNNSIRPHALSNGPSGEHLSSVKGYTILVEIRNNNTTLPSSGNADMYTQQTVDTQFWGNGTNYGCTAEGAPNNTGTINFKVIGESYKYYMHRTQNVGTTTTYFTNPNNPVYTELFRYNLRIGPGGILDFDIRFSIYEGYYEGEYLPYVEDTLYLTDAQTRLAKTEASNLIMLDNPPLIYTVNTNSVQRVNWWVMQSTNSTGISIEKTSNGVKITRSGTSTSYATVPLKPSNKLLNGDAVTLSFDYKTNTTRFGQVVFITSNNAQNQTQVSGNNIKSLEISESSWKHYEFTWTVINNSIYSDLVQLAFYGWSNQVNDWIEIKDGTLKLEKGNTLTRINEAEKRSNVDISVVSINYGSNTATLKATLYVDGVAKTSNVAYQWYKDNQIITGQTTQQLSVTSTMGLNHVYSCNVGY